MNFQEKLFETTADLRTRAAKQVHVLKGSLTTLTIAGREFNKVARSHAARFVKENSTIVASAGKDVTALARTTYATLAKRGTAPRKAAKAPAARKRAARKAA